MVWRIYVIMLSSHPDKSKNHDDRNDGAEKFSKKIGPFKESDICWEIQ